MDAKWKRKLGSRLMKHVAESTESGTLAEVRRNIAHMVDEDEPCSECEEIARKLGINTTTDHANLMKLIKVSRAVIANWESGDLAGAVRDLSNTLAFLEN